MLGDNLWLLIGLTGAGFFSVGLFGSAITPGRNTRNTKLFLLIGIIGIAIGWYLGIQDDWTIHTL